MNLRDLGEGITPYPFVLAYAQDVHERFLVDQLAEGGASVAWNTRIETFTQDAGGVRATIVSNGEAEHVDVAYLCGCDGTHSQVRETLGVGFPGGTYEQLFYVADVKTAAPMDCDLRLTLGEHVLALMLPVRTTGMQRLIGLVPPELSSRTDLRFDDVRARVEPLLGISVTNVNWFSSYRVHHRVAEHFKVGRVFLLGDAAHVHSPVGAQGMNTGIGDAIDLGWKLADVVRGRANTTLLDTYEPERIGFARTLVTTTDRAFVPMVAEGVGGELARRVLAPLVFSAATRFDFTKHAFFRRLSQIRINYHGSPLSEGEAGDVRGGDRLPWLGQGAEDNFAPLTSLDWQLKALEK